MALFGRRAASVRPDVPEHAVHFYADDAALIAKLATYVADGTLLGETTVIIATPAHHQLLVEQLGSEQALLALEAQGTLDSFMVDGLPDPELFDATVGTLVRSLAGQGLRAYGEMVSLLWDQGNVAGTLQLEDLWNALQLEVDFPLLCAYGISQFEGRPGLARVCDAHTHVLPLAS